MLLRDRVLSNIILCGVEIAFQATALPSTIEGWQPFYNNIFENTTFEKAYASVASINFDQEGASSNAGFSYKQRVTFRFPNSDGLSAERISLLEKIKYVKLKQNNGLDIVVGRNDFIQNTAPTIKIANDEQLCQVTIESLSISPSGYTPTYDRFGLPAFIPLSF